MNSHEIRWIIDDLAIWNRVLSAADISYYNNSSPCDESTPSNQLGCDIDGESQYDYSDMELICR